MSNSNYPFGFSQWAGTGTTPSYEMFTGLISSAYGTAIYTGDAVIQHTDGFIQQKVAADGIQLAGIFMGCTYLNTSLQRTVWSPYWPGSGASGDVTAYVVNDPNAQWLVQAVNTAVAFLNIGENIDIGTSPSGSTITGRSGMTVDQSTLGTGTTLPFKVVNLFSYFANPGVNGTDNASAYNQVIVRFNNINTKTPIGVA